MINQRVYLLSTIVFTLVCLTACGGGSNGNNQNPIPNQNPIDQTLIFTDPGPVELYVGDSFSNPAVGSGTGVVSYSSSNNQVAKVDGNGLVTVQGAGQATVTADKQGDSRYTGASATFDIIGRLRANTVRFKHQGTMTPNIGDSISNPASGRGAAGIHYASSDEQIATVDGQGKVNILKWGAATITASQEADSNFSAAYASYKLRTAIPMSAWIGEQDTLVSFSSEASGVGFHRTTEKGCEPHNFTICENGASTILDGQPVIDSTANLSRKAYYSLYDGEHSVSNTVSSQHFPAAYGEQMLALHNNELWLVRDREVWSSADGIDWTLVTENVDFSARHSRQLVSFRGKLWLIGGHGSEGSNIWSSVDGESWAEEQQSAEIGNRMGHQVVPHGDKLWLTGGRDQEYTSKNDVLSSDDGVHWRLEKEKAAYPARSGHQMISHNDKLWIVGSSSPFVNDVWMSENGTDWSLITQDAGFSTRGRHKVISHNGKLWLVSGDDGGDYKNAVWSSSNGRTWDRLAESTNFSARYGHWLASLDDKLLLISGNEPNGNPLNDIWSSSDGIAWTKEAPSTEFSTGYSHQLVYHGGKLWLFGSASSESLNDTWSSSDGGSTWSLVPQSTPFPKLIGRRVVSLGERLWSVITTQDDQFQYHNEFWYSDDGEQWKQVEPQGGIFSGRISFELVSHNGKLWVIGGFINTDPFTYLNDVWSSDDGIHWQLNTESADFPGRTHHKVVSHNEKLVLIGGINSVTDSNGGHLYDVWESTDGSNWDLLSDSVPYSSRRGHQAVSHNGKLWMVGGIAGDGNYKNDIWMSSDGGASWSKVISNAPFSPRYYHQLVGDGQKLWLTGGMYSGSSAWLNGIWRSEDGINWRILHKRQFIFPSSE